MRLLDTQTGQFVEEDHKSASYAILSHTWSLQGEQTYHEVRAIQKRYRTSGPSSRSPSPSLPPTPTGSPSPGPGGENGIDLELGPRPNFWSMASLSDGLWLWILSSIVLPDVRIPNLFS